MSRLGSLIGKASRGVGRGAIRASGSRVAMGTIAAGAFGLGFLNKTAPAARDAAFESVLGDKDADVAYTGRKLDTRFLLGAATGGVAGGLMKYSSPSNAFAFNPVISDSSAMSSVAVGASALAGGVIGTYGAKAAKYGKNAAVGTQIFGEFATKYPKMGKLTKGLGALATNRAGGALVGAAAFGALAVKGLVGNQYEENRRFVAESPYMPGGGSMATAQALNASGDIVLGMHNSRRGY